MFRNRTKTLHLELVAPVVLAAFFGFGLVSVAYRVLESASVVEAQARTAFPSTAVLTDATATTSSAAQRPANGVRTFHVYGATTAGAGTATVVIEVSNIETPATAGTADWITAGTVTLTLGTTRVSDGFVMDAPWRNVRARVSAISGTGASVSVRMGN